VCSTAFAVTINGADYLLTAAHCGGINTYWDVTDWYHGGPGDGLYLGTESNRIAADDTAIIRVNSTQPDIYDKGWNSTVSERVIGAVDTYRNSWICTEGATSGARCAGQVYFADATIYIDGLGWLNHESGASSSAHLTAGGDSGGPVIVNSPYAGDVYATGTITGYENPAACPSNNHPDLNPRPVCSHDVVYETIYNVLADWGASMK
jgi:hypothetical protein